MKLDNQKRLEFNSKNVQEVFESISKLPASEKEAKVEAIRKDLKTYVQERFDLSAEQRALMMSMSKDYFKFLGGYLSLMIDNDLKVEFSDAEADAGGTQKAARKKCKTTVKTEINYDQSSGWGGSVGASWTF